MESNRFRGLGLDRRAELKFPVVCSDQSVAGEAELPLKAARGLPILERELAPEGVDDFDANADVAEKFTTKSRGISKPISGGHISQSLPQS